MLTVHTSSSCLHWFLCLSQQSLWSFVNIYFIELLLMLDLVFYSLPLYSYICSQNLFSDKALCGCKRSLIRTLLVSPSDGRKEGQKWHQHNAITCHVFLFMPMVHWYKWCSAMRTTQCKYFSEWMVITVFFCKCTSESLEINLLRCFWSFCVGIFS